MRNFLLTVFWIANIGSVIQLLIMAAAGWLIFSGHYSFCDLNVVVFVTQVAPWLHWVETVVVTLLGDFGRWILSIPIFIISPIKFMAGAIIGWWAYSRAKKMPVKPAYTQESVGPKGS